MLVSNVCAGHDEQPIAWSHHSWPRDQPFGMCMSRSQDLQLSARLSQILNLQVFSPKSFHVDRILCEIAAFWKRAGCLRNVVMASITFPAGDCGKAKTNSLDISDEWAHDYTPLLGLVFGGYCHGLARGFSGTPHWTLWWTCLAKCQASAFFMALSKHTLDRPLQRGWTDVKNLPLSLSASCSFTF